MDAITAHYYATAAGVELVCIDYLMGASYIDLTAPQLRALIATLGSIADTLEQRQTEQGGAQYRVIEHLDHPLPISIPG